MSQRSSIELPTSGSDLASDTSTIRQPPSETPSTSSSVPGSRPRTTRTEPTGFNVSSSSSQDSVLNYGNAGRYDRRTSGSDHRPAPASFTSFQNRMSSIDDSMSDRSVPTQEELRVPFQAIVDMYNQLLNYVSTGRAAMLEEIAENERGGMAVAESFQHLAPANRANLEMVLEAFQAKINEMKRRVQIFDEDIPLTRQRIVAELMMAMETVNHMDLYQLVQEFRWPTEAVCADLQLPYDFILMARGDYMRNPRTTPRTEGPESNTINAQNEELIMLRRRLAALENAANVNVPHTVNNTPRAAIIQDPVQERRKIDINERRKRTRFDIFSNGGIEEALTWMQRFEFLCKYCHYEDEDKVDLLAVTLTGTALTWLQSITDYQNDLTWKEAKSQFWKKFGGGADPTLVALKELKKLHQGSKSMKVFGPMITNLLTRAEIFAPGVQLDYFKDRVRPELRTAIIYRGPATLDQAIQITIEIEDDLKRTIGARPSAVGSIPAPIKEYASSTTGSGTEENQNYQHGSNARQEKGEGRYKDKNRKETRRCFNCNLVGHLAANCRKPKKEKEESKKQQLLEKTDEEGIIDIFSHLSKLPQNSQVATSKDPSENLDVKARRFAADILVDGQKHIALVDTGATISSIKEITATKLGLKRFATKPRQIQYGNKSIQVTKEKAIINFEINGINTTAYLFVVDQQNEEIIVGMDWMIGEDLYLHPRTKSVARLTEQQNPQAIEGESEEAVLKRMEDNILEKYPSLIPQEGTVQQVTNAPYKHRIVTGDALPVVVRDYRRPQVENDQIAIEVKKMLDQGVIEPSTSPWCSPVVLIKKKDSSAPGKQDTKPVWRFCVDFRRLNAVTQKDKFPIGNLNELLDQLHGCKYLSTIDLKNGYWHIPMDPRDAQKTAFIANGKLYQFKVLPFGCVTGPNSFSRFMSGVINGLARTKVYLDDIIVYSNSLEQHEQDLKAILQRLTEYNLKISVKKCKFFRREVKYLGYIVSDKGIRSDTEHVKAVTDWKIPTTVNALQRFLGFCAFYHRFLKNMSAVAAPLYNLLRKDAKYEWSKTANDAFNKLKNMLVTLPTLAYPNYRKGYDVHTDGSTFGLGAVIVQEGRPVAFASRTLNEHEKRYSATEIEALGVHFALKQFHPYLYGAQLTIYTDHAALKSILSTKEPKGRIARWIMAIQCHTFTIIHRKGALNADADALSRKEQVNDQEATNEDPVENARNRLKKAQKSDMKIQAIMKLGVKLPYIWKFELLYYQYEDGKSVPVIPQEMVSPLLRSTHNVPTGGHFGLEKTLSKVKLLGFWDTMIDDTKKWIQHCHDCQVYKVRTDSTSAPMKPIIPTRFGEIWAMDIAMLPLSNSGNRYLLVLMEYLSKWCVTVALPSFDTEHVAQALLYEVVLKISMPTRIISDNGTNFISEAMQTVCARLGIKRSMTSVEYPQTDGLVERMNRTIKVSLATVVNQEPTTWDDYLQFVTFAYNTAKQSTTGYSPFQIMYGRDPQIPNEEGIIVENPKTYETESWAEYLNKYVPLLHGKAIKNIEKAKGYQKTFYDKGRKVRYDYKVGDLVLRRNLEKSTFPKQRWIGPYKVLAQNNEDGTSWKLVKLSDPQQNITTGNVRHLRPYCPQEDQELGLQNLQEICKDFCISSVRISAKGEIM